METRSRALSRLFAEHAAGRLSRRDLLAAAAGMGVLLASGPLGRTAFAQDAGTGEGEPRRGGTLKVAAPPATTIDPVMLNSPGAIAIVQQAAEYLVYAEPDMSLRPVLATSWEPGEDGRVWTFELRRGVRFHDGRAMTADDVVA
ncbi:MAG TPA: ABC transporter substrate-binding protein, partial [Arenibaculum sp.]|nr:ABC transporter substrate-binding protein [Arenibaculum sp.]